MNASLSLSPRTLLVVAVLLCVTTTCRATGTTGSLRRHQATTQTSTTIQGHVGRALQTGSGYDNEYPVDENESSDVGLLNRLIALLLPHINTAFQSGIPDPLPLAADGKFSTGDLDLMFCQASMDVMYDFGSVVGLSNLAIDSLRVIPGSESVRVGCLDTLWNALFDVTVASPDSFTVQNTTVGFSANVCGAAVEETFSGGVNTNRPILRGIANISGALFGTLAKIDVAKMGGSLEIGYDSIEAFIDGVPEEFNTFLANATRELSVVMKQELTSTVVPTVKPIVVESMRQQNVTISYLEFMSITAGFARNEGQRRFTRFYETATNYIGSTRLYQNTVNLFESRLFAGGHEHH